MHLWLVPIWALSAPPPALGVPSSDTAAPPPQRGLDLSPATAGPSLSPPDSFLFEIEEPAPRVGTPYQLNPYLHGGLAAAGLGLMSVLEVGVKGHLDGGLGCEVPAGMTRCAPSDVNGFDRLALGNRSETWADISDVALWGGIGASFMGLTLDALLSDSDTKGHDLLTDGIVFAESVALGTLASSLLKYTVRRPRPSQYDPEVPIGGFDDQLSFPSGHTTAVAAAAFSFATTFWLRHPDSPWRWVVGSGAAAVTALTGMARVGAGRHFPTDVLAGGALGAGVGLLVPLLHYWLGADGDENEGEDQGEGPPQPPRRRMSLPRPASIGDHGGRGVVWTLHF